MGCSSLISSLCKVLLSIMHELSKEQMGSDEGGCAGFGLHWIQAVLVRGAGAGVLFFTMGPTWQNQ